MAVISMQQLLEAGVHFGHATRRWNPKMGKYIYTSRNGIYIIDLQKTQKLVEDAYKVLLGIAKEGKKVLFVGTKKQSQEVVREEAIRSGQFYVDNRWLGGTLTNFKTISKRIKRLHDLYKMEKDGIFDRLPKKEVVGLMKERAKLEKFLGGIKDMKKMPGAIYVVDPRKERNAILEARKLGIPVFGIVDTNCDPDDVDYVIPANDDAIRAVKLITGVMANAVIEANGGEVPKFTAEEAKAVKKPTRRPNDSRNNNRNGNRRYNDNRNDSRNNGGKRPYNNSKSSYNSKTNNKPTGSKPASTRPGTKPATRPATKPTTTRTTKPASSKPATTKKA